MAGEARSKKRDLAPRSRPSKFALWFRILAVVVLVVGLAIRGAGATLLAGLAVLGIFVSLLTLRRKAASPVGSIWSMSADLVRDRQHLPGQLALTSEALVWIPAAYSVRHGEGSLSVPLHSCRDARLEAGPALIDVFVDLEPSGGAMVRFLTRRGQHLDGLVEQLVEKS